MKAAFFDDDFDDEWEEPEDAEPDPLDPFFADGTIVEVLGELKSGKEGTVYSCRGGSAVGETLLAAKVYRSRNLRNFKNDAIYSQGRSFGKARENRAVKNKSRLGREIQFHAWIGHEWEILKTLAKAGVAVPLPVAVSNSAILMSLIGDEGGPAPLLHSVDVPVCEVRQLFDQLIHNIELMLSNHIVHGDLSPYNLLYWRNRLVIIDLPQAVDVRVNLNAFELLCRDLDRVCAYFIRRGINTDPNRLARHIWNRYRFAEL